MNKRHGLRWGLCVALCLVGAAGVACETTAVNRDAKTTLLDSDDMVAMTNKMARSLIAEQRVTAAAAQGPLKIVIRPVENLTNEILPDNQAELFVARLQGLLSSQPELANKFVWVINRSDYAKLRAEVLPESKLGPSEDRIVPEYMLHAEFRSLTNVSRGRRSDTYLCQYKLTKISGGGAGAVLWLGEYQTSKEIRKGFLD